MPPTLVYEAFLKRRLSQFSQYEWARSEVAFWDSRLDLVLSDSALCYVEMKSVALAEEGIGFFLDVPTSRGMCYLNALAMAKIQGHRAAVIFVVQGNDVQSFSLNDDADPFFGVALREVRAANVEVCTYRCPVSPREVALAELIPVNISYSPQVG